MRKLTSFFMVIAAVLFFAANTFAQLSGTKNIPGDYASLDAAIIDLNTVGVGSGGVVLNLLAANPQTAPAGGYVIGGAGSLVLSTTSMANPVTIQGNSNTITANASLTIGALNDGIFKLIGADWVTITGFTMEENAANVVTAAATNTMTEWGVALLYVTTTDGAQHNTITGNTIDLNRTYQNTFGIYSNSTHSSTTVTSSVTATTTAGGNSHLTITSNNVTDVNHGIVVVGPTAAADQNDSIRIGVGSGTGNTLTNYGTTGTFSGYANVSGTVNGILVRNSKNNSINYNSITSSNGGVTAGTINGIQMPAFSVAPTGTFSTSISNNTLSIKSGLIAGAINGINLLGTSASVTSILNIDNNDFNNFGHTVAGTAAIIFITNAGTHLTQSISNNTFTNMSVNTTGAVTFIANTNTPPANSVKNVNNNSIVTAFAKTGAGGSVTFFVDNGSDVSTSTNNSNNNTFTNITVSGAATVTGVGNTNGGAPIKNVVGNTVGNITGGTGAIIGLSINFDAGTTTVTSNTVSNITGGGAITGILFGTSGTAGTTNSSLNIVHTLTGSGTGIVSGIISGGAATTNRNHFRNKVYNLENTNAAGFVNGITVSSGNANVYNNLVGDLRAPNAVSVSALAPSVRGINVTAATALTTVNFYNNSVYLNASSIGATFSTAALFATTSATATTGALTIRNNALINLSTPAGVGVSTAYMRSSTTLTNYAAASNTNIFYGGAPDATHLIFYDGTNSVQTIGDFKTLVASREANSGTENPTFLSTTASSVDFLKVDPTVATQLESGGATISSPAITVDYYNVARYPNVGYPENMSFPASAPDIGANEFGGIPVDMNPPNISYTVLGNTSNLTDRVLTSTITDGTGVPTAGALQPRIYYQKNGGSFFSSQGSLFSGSGTNGVWNLTIDESDMGGIAPGDIIGYFVIAQDIAGPYITSNPSTGLVATDVNTVTTPPTPNTYTVVGVPLSGDYTVGSTLFRAVTGLNITFEERIRKVMKEIPLVNDAPASKNSGQEAKEHLFGEAYAPGTSTMVEVDQVYSVPMLNGREYTGKLYHTLSREEKRQHNLSDNMLGIYLTLTAAVADVNLRGVGATDCRLLLNDVLYNTGTGETFPIIIDAQTQLPTASSNLIIKPNTGVTASITETSTSGIIVSRAPYVVFDGTAVGNSGTRDLTISNTSSTANSYTLGMFNNTAPRKADNNTVKYCNITGGQVAASTNAVFGIVLNAAGGDYDNCVIDNNIVTSVRTAIQVAGVSGFTSDNVTVSNNVIGSTTDASSCFFQGIVVSQADNTVITQNELIGQVLGNIINGQSGNATLNIAGIVASTGATNTKIRRNNIHDWYFAGTTQGYGAKGIVYANTGNNTGTTEISNNLIYQIKGDSDNESTIAGSMGFVNIGICISLNGTSAVQVYNNSVYLSGATISASFNGSSAALGIAGTVGAGSMDVRNNLFRNSMTGAGTGACMGIWVPGAVSNNIFSNLNNNNYFTDGLNPVVGYFTTLRATLANWQSASGQDGASLSGSIPFMSTTDLTIDATSSNAWYVSGLGYPLAAVATDYTGASRSTTLAGGATDLGAYNVTPSSVPPTATESAAPAPSTTTSYTLAGKTLATLTWGAGGTPPTSMALDYFPGVNPPGSAGFNVGNGYWVFTPTGGSGYSYDVLFNYNEAQLGTIPSEGVIRLAKSDDGGALYTPYLVQGTGAGQYTLDTVANTIQVNGLTTFSMFGLTENDLPLPVELSSFSANTNKNNVDLNWSTVSEVNNTGFEVERKLVSTTTWGKVGFVAGAGNSTTVKNYTFSDKNLATAKYNYRLKQIDNNGNINYHNLSGEVIVGVPTKFDISQNYPNPFNPTTKINYDLPFDSKVSIKIFDMTGKEVATVINSLQTAGYHTVQFNGSNLASGVYFYNIIAEGGNAAKFVTTKKMVLVK